MPMDTYQGRYTDRLGTEEIRIENDSTTLWTTIRGVAFSGNRFDDLCIADRTPPDLAARFTLHGDSLCSCRIEYAMPIPVWMEGGEQRAGLTVVVVLGDVISDKHCLDREEYLLTLEHDGRLYAGTGNSGSFEGELLEIQAQLPPGVHMKACITCMYSDYSPYGQNAFGDMACYRTRKSEYLKVKGKMQFLKFQGHFDRMVQETYLCPEFERRVPGTGYRG